MKKLSLQPIAPESYAETSRWLWVQSWNNSLYLAWLIPMALFKSVSGSKTSCATKESTLEKEHEETVSATHRTHSTRKLCWNFTVTLGAILKQLTLPSLIDTDGFVQICFNLFQVVRPVVPQKKAHWKRNMKKLSLQPIAPESYAETSRWLWVQSWNNSLYLAWLIPMALFKSVSGSKTSCATKESTLEKEHEETVSATHSTRKLCWNFTVTLGAILKQLTLPSLIDTDGFVQICFNLFQVVRPVVPQKKAHWKRNMKKLSLQPIAPESYAETSRWLWVQSWNNSLYLAWLIPMALFKSVSICFR